MAPKTERRAKEILRLLLQHGKTSVEGLADAFATSPASIRRDLVRLEQQGLVHRTHGGAMLAGQIYEPFRFDASFKEREERFPREKHHIAVLAADLVNENETIGLTSGTTTTQVARSLRLRKNLHILTNAVNIALELGSRDGLTTTLTGGCMRWPGAFSLTGPMALETVELVFLDKLFLGVCGIDPVHGATVIESDEAQLFRAMTKRAREVIVVADSSKVGMTSPAMVCPIGRVNTLVTDSGIAPEVLQAFQANGVRTLIAK